MLTTNMQKQKGASIYFALDILAIMMAIVVGISTIIIVQLTNIKEGLRKVLVPALQTKETEVISQM